MAAGQRSRESLRPVVIQRAVGVLLVRYAGLPRVPVRADPVRAHGLGLLVPRLGGKRPGRDDLLHGRRRGVLLPANRAGSERIVSLWTGTLHGRRGAGSRVRRGRAGLRSAEVRGNELRVTTVVMGSSGGQRARGGTCLRPRQLEARRRARPLTGATRDSTAAAPPSMKRTTGYAALSGLRALGERNRADDRVHADLGDARAGGGLGPYGHRGW
jgi:hypothetical protein